MKLRTFITAAGAAVLVLLGAGCADDGAQTSGASQDATHSAGAPDPLDPCQLLTAADLAAVTRLVYHHIPTPESAGPETPGRLSCHYEETNDPDGLPSAAWVTLFPTDRVDFDSERDALMQLPLGLAEIGAIGETAYGDDDEIRVFQSPWYVEVQVKTADLKGTEPIKSLAQTVLSRLP